MFHPWRVSAAAQLGLRYLFAGLINQPGSAQIIQFYRDNFKPMKGLSGIEKPEVIFSVHVVCANTDEEERKQLAPVIIMYQNLSAGRLDIDLPMPVQAVKQLGYLPVIISVLPDHYCLQYLLGLILKVSNNN